MDRRRFLKVSATGMWMAQAGAGASKRQDTDLATTPPAATKKAPSSTQVTGIYVVAPSVVGAGETFSVGVKMLTKLFQVPLTCYTTHYPSVSSSTSCSFRYRDFPDGLGFHYRSDVPAEWTGTLTVSSDESYEGPDRISFADGVGPYPHDHRPIKRMAPVRFRTPGVHVIHFTEPVSGITQASNAITVTADTPKERLFWADIHGHTILTDGVRSPEECYYFGRDEAFLDICALSDHTEYSPLTDRMWEYMTAVTNDFNEPGRFVTLVGQEWTNMKLGHRNLYYRKDRAPRIRWTDPNYSTLPQLYEFARQHGALVVPHHPATAAMGCDWSLGHDPEVERLVEIYSTWGSSERYLGEGHPRRIHSGEVHGQHVVDALQRGYRFGIIASGDVHDGRPGHSLNRNNLGQLAGLMGVWARDLTRESVFRAMWNRHVYGTTGCRVVLRFSMSGRPMGSMIPYRNDLPVEVDVRSEAPISQIALVRNGEDCATKEPGGLCEVVWRLTESPPRTPTPYYVRVTREDGELAWSSPIWTGAA